MGFSRGAEKRELNQPRTVVAARVGWGTRPARWGTRALAPVPIYPGGQAVRRLCPSSSVRVTFGRFSLPVPVLIRLCSVTNRMRRTETPRLALGGVRAARCPSLARRRLVAVKWRRGGQGAPVAGAAVCVGGGRGWGCGDGTNGEYNGIPGGTITDPCPHKRRALSAPSATPPPRRGWTQNHRIAVLTISRFYFFPKNRNIRIAPQ